MNKENIEEVIFINNIPYYRIQNGTSYEYRCIPKEFKIYFDRLQQENNQLKEQYCERTDCGGRLGNSKKVERLENTIKELRSWLEEQEKRAWDEVSSTFGYVLDKLNELEGGKND